MTTTPTPTCVGFAMYLELEKSSSVTQVLFMPEGTSSAHRDVPITMYRRRLTSITPRKTWRQAQSLHKYSDLRTTDVALSAEKAIEQMISFSTTYLNTLAENGWKVRNQIITVEVTAEDLEDARQAKTPYKVLGRVWKVRKKLGFPKDFIVVPEPTTTPAF